MTINERINAALAADAKRHPRLVECGICGAYHPAGFDGDCRDDDNRYPHAIDCDMDEDCTCEPKETNHE